LTAKPQLNTGKNEAKKEFSNFFGYAILLSVASSLASSNAFSKFLP
jgi:hypothetical protein